MDLFEYAKAQEQPLEEEAQPADQLDMPIVTVGELTSDVKKLITGAYGRESMWVKGELSNFKGRNQSGHMYFRLKDDRAVLNCVYFRNANRSLKIDLKEGLEVLVRGRLDVWERGGNYQLIVEEIRPGGTGELYLKFEQLKKRLEEEGLFDPERKKAIPEFPQRIGIVTSPTGAVIRDIIHVVERRCPFVKLLLYPVKVQGDGSKEEIAKALEAFQTKALDVDLIIVGRGGGSIEDLWSFNEEVVARAIATSKVPVISAVGHQTDYTIADFVSDIRAATPSQAAELAVPDMSDIRRKVRRCMQELIRELVRKRDVSAERLQRLTHSAPLRDPKVLIRDRTQRLDQAIERMSSALVARREKSANQVIRLEDQLRVRLKHYIQPFKLRMKNATGGLDLLSPLSILSRGYSYVTKENGKIIKRSKQVKVGENVSVRFSQGKAACQVKKIYEA